VSAHGEELTELRRRLVLYERACAALTVLVRMEYRPHFTLAEIASRWGEGISEEQIEALAWLESHDDPK
jgi:hypothetical protein